MSHLNYWDQLKLLRLQSLERRRERYRYQGQVRAIGEVLIEQLAFMVRSGFDAFEIEEPKALEEFERVCAEVRVVYQPTGDGMTTALQRRLGG